MATTTSIIPAEFEALVQDAVASGRYGSPQEILTAALTLWKQREEQLDKLRADLQIGIDQLDRGEWSDGEEAIRRIRDTIANRQESQQ